MSGWVGGWVGEKIAGRVVMAFCLEGVLLPMRGCEEFFSRSVSGVCGLECDKTSHNVVSCSLLRCVCIF